ncbi:ionotropic receptor 75a-like [Culicoides brevitarsis]|uniref:ionotropic receptor 75a-like n=1 Tax=Culicoides brevitarsis TaxID=469753 RepID=UPI00307B94A2
MKPSILFLLNIFMVVQAWDANLLQKLIIQESVKVVDVLFCDNIRDDILPLLKKSSSTMTSSFELHNIDGNDFDLFSFNNCDDMTVIADLKCPNMSSVLNQASDLKFFNSSRKWIFIGDEDLNGSLSFMETLDINVDSKITLIQISEGVFEIYKVGSPALRRSGILEVKLVAMYSNSVLKYEKSEIGFVKKDLQGIQLVVAIAIEKTPKHAIFLNYIRGKGFGHRDAFSRLSFQFVMLLSELYNFKISVRKAITWGYPVPGKPGIFDGVVGMLQRHECDFGAVGISYLPIRHSILDSGLSVQKFRQYMIFRHPRTSTGMKNVFLSPLSNVVWMCLASILVLMVFCLYIFHFYEKTIDSLPLSLSIVTVIGIFASQGVTKTFKGLHARIALLFSLIMSIICLQFYSASIVSSLLLPTPRTITTMRNLAMSNLKVIMEDIPTSNASFRVSIDENAIFLYNTKIKQFDRLFSIEEGVTLVKKGNYAFYTYVDFAYDFMRNTFTFDELDDLQEIPFYPLDHRSMLYMAVEKHSPFKELIRVGNQKFAETGLRSYVTEKFTSKPPVGNLKNQMFKNAVVDLHAFSSILYMLVTGMILSFMILFFEVLAKKIENFKNK